MFQKVFIGTSYTLWTPKLLTLIYRVTTYRRFSSVAAATGIQVGRRSLGGSTSAASAIAEESSSESEAVEIFCLEVSALQKLMSSEQVAMVGIIPHQFQRRIFEIVARDSLDTLTADGEAIIARVRKAGGGGGGGGGSGGGSGGGGNSDFLAILTVFHVIRHVMQVKPRMDRTLEGCDAGVRSRYNTLVHQFFVTGQTALDGFVEGVRSDATARERMPKDGTVFQLTSNVILFLEQLLDYVETVALVLQQVGKHLAR